MPVIVKRGRVSVDDHFTITSVPLTATRESSPCDATSFSVRLIQLRPPTPPFDLHFLSNLTHFIDIVKSKTRSEGANLPWRVANPADKESRDFIDSSAMIDTFSRGVRHAMAWRFWISQQEE